MGYEERLRRLTDIRAGRERYGDSRGAAEQAQAYLLDEMFDDVLAFARKRSDPLPGRVDMLISLVGFSPVTTALTYALLRPYRVLAITSAAAMDSLDAIWGVLQRLGLPVSRFQHQSCEPTNPQNIYGIVKDGMDLLRRQSDGTPPYAVIDITGGRKVMSAAAALVAWQLDLDLCYLDGEFDRATQLSRPETNRLLLLRNPMTIFGEQETQRADEQFRAGAYEIAASRYQALAESIRQPTRARFMHALSRLYQAWCDLDLDALGERIPAVRAQLRHAADELTSGTLTRVREQLDFAERLGAGDEQALVLCYYLLGLHYQAVGRRDFAALLHYRTIEKCLVLRLKQRAPGFAGDAPDYTLLESDLTRLSRRYGDIAAEVWPVRPDTQLPAKIGLMNAALLLRALDDELLGHARFNGTAGLRHLLGLADARNQSILAHGDRPVTLEEVRALSRGARKTLEAYWVLGGAAGRLHERCERLAFLTGEL